MGQRLLQLLFQCVTKWQTCQSFSNHLTPVLVRCLQHITRVTQSNFKDAVTSTTIHHTAAYPSSLNTVRRATWDQRLLSSPPCGSPTRRTQWVYTFRKKARKNFKFWEIMLRALTDVITSGRHDKVEGHMATHFTNKKSAAKMLTMGFNSVTCIFPMSL